MTNYLPIILVIVCVIYIVGIRLLFHVFIEAEKRIVKVLSTIGLWGLFTIGEVCFFKWMISFLFEQQKLPSDLFSTAAVTILIWNIIWLFMIIVSIFMKKKRNLTKIQKSILQDL